MKKIFSVLVVVLMMVGVVSAQETQMKGTQAGDESINFTFGGLGAFGLGAAGIGGGISGTYFLSSDAAVRVGLQLANTSTSTKAVAGSGAKDAESSTLNIGVGGDYLMYLGTNGSRVRPFVGGGVAFTMNSGSTTAPSGTETKTGGITFGLAGIAGAEFFLYNELSISAEYQLNLININSPSDTEVTPVGGPTTKTPGTSVTNILGFGSAGATIHIYF